MEKSETECNSKSEVKIIFASHDALVILEIKKKSSEFIKHERSPRSKSLKMYSMTSIEC